MSDSSLKTHRDPGKGRRGGQALWTACCVLGVAALVTGVYFAMRRLPLDVSPLPLKPLASNKRVSLNERIPIMGPLTSGGPAIAQPLRDDEVLRAWAEARPTRVMPLLEQVQLNNVRIVKDKIADYIDPPRDVPLIGNAQLHHAHYKCTIYFDEVKRVGLLLPRTNQNTGGIEVIYVDHNHYHMLDNEDGQ